MDAGLGSTGLGRLSATELAGYDGLGQAELVAAGEITPTELVGAAIALIEELNPRLNAVIHKHYERALDQARSDLPAGPFRGVPFLLKDLGGGNVAGDPNHWGTRFLRDANHTSPTTAYVVEKFRRAGLVILGRTNVPELGLWATTESDAYGPARNPWNPEHSTGGSSGGAGAAVASGMVPVAHANDGGGSIRIPASECGLVGLKLTRGRVSLGPDLGEAWGGLEIEFALTRSVRDAAALLDCVHGMMPGDPYGVAPPVRPYAQEVRAAPGSLRVGVLAEHDVIDVHADCVAAAHAAARLLEDLGHRVEAAYPQPLAGSALQEPLMTMTASAQARLVASFGEIVGTELGPEDMDGDNWALAEMGQQISAVQYLAATERLAHYQRQIAAWWAAGFDLLITPTLAGPPPLIGELVPDPAKPLDAFLRSAALVPFTMPFNVTGQPAVSLPLHSNDTGLPIGVQVVAAFGREDLLVRIASQLEEAVRWRERQPIVHA